MAMNRREFTTTSILGISGSLLFGCSNNERFSFKKNQVIACLGDSITYANGSGYVDLLQKIANDKRPDLNLTFLNLGRNSETVTGLTEEGHPEPRPYLFERLDSLLENTKVDLIIFCYGINCGIYGKPSPQLFDSFRIGVLSFLEKVKQKNIAAILMTPPPLTLETAPIPLDESKPFSWKNPYSKYDLEVLQEFKSIVLSIDHKSVVAKIDIHSPLSEHQKECYDSDPIHPNEQGHFLIADTLAKSLNFV